MLGLEYRISSCVNSVMGYSRNNPHPPQGWQAGNPGGRGSQEGLVIQVGEGIQARKFFFRGYF